MLYSPTNWAEYSQNMPYESPEPTYSNELTPMYQTPRDITVPQRPYVANIQRNHVFNIRPLVFMTSQGHGIRLSDIQARVNTGLLNADLQPLEGFGTKVTYRIEWPGYESFNKQKHALRATRQKQSVSLQKVALHVAEVMKDFIQENGPQRCSEPAWRVGQGYIEFEDLYLLEVHQVAKASLQPVIAYRPRTTVMDTPPTPYSTFYTQPLVPSYPPPAW